MNNSYQLKMQLGQSHYIINITDSFFNGELKELFIDICKMNSLEYTGVVLM